MRGKHYKAETSRRSLPIVRYMLYLLIVTLTVSGVSLSRYATSSPGADQARVAKLDVVVTHPGWNNYDVSSHATGGTKGYELRVTNNSEVAVRARLVIDGSGGSVFASPSGWFDLPLGAWQDIAVTVTGTAGGNVVQMHVEYEQID